MHQGHSDHDAAKGTCVLIRRASLTRRQLIAAAPLAGLALAGGATLNRPAAGARAGITVATTVGMITDVVERIGGERLNVKGLMGPGIDPHLYKPSAGDIRLLGDADVIFYGGLHLEGRLVDTLAKIRKSGKAAIPVSESIPEDRLHKADGFGGAHDPHVWFDVSLWSIAAATIGTTLAELFPEHAGAFGAGTERYRAELAALDAYVTERAQRLPAAQRVLVTAHDAFGYFANRYGFEVMGLQGVSTATEAGAGDVQTLAKYITDHRIRAIFVESSVPHATIEAVQQACRANGWDVRIGGELFSDALGQRGTPAGTYIGMVRHNIDTIVTALSGDPATPATRRTATGHERGSRA
jgi:manganese/zinc/iron transport system substrate-binding protein